MTVAKYGEDFLEYLSDKKAAYPKDTSSFLIMNQYGPWNITVKFDIKAIGAILLAITLRAENEIKKEIEAEERIQKRTPKKGQSMMRFPTYTCHLLLVIYDPDLPFVVIQSVSRLSSFGLHLYIYLFSDLYIHARLFMIFFDLTSIPFDISLAKIMASERRNNRTLKLS